MMQPDRLRDLSQRLVLKDSVQIAGVADQGEARMLIDCGVDYIGFPLNVPIHSENVTEADTAAIISRITSPDRAVLITYLDEASSVAELCQKIGATIVQLHADIEPDEIAKLKLLDANLRIVKSVIIDEDRRADFSSEINAAADHVDAFITDTFDPSTAARGATGKTHDWRKSREIVELSPRPVILAGGLNPSNVRRAISDVRPAGVDVHTGVEDSAGKKVRQLVEAFVSEARDAFSRLH